MYSIKECLICLENIDVFQYWIQCQTCNIKLHKLCEKNYRKETKWCKCPHCNKIGSLLTCEHNDKVLNKYFNDSFKRL